MTGIADMDYQMSIADAVRGKLAECGISTITQLADIIGKSRPTAGSRWHGHTGYTVAELEDIARHLDISVYDLNDAARIRSERKGRDALPGESVRISPTAQDAWAQPSRAKARRAS